MDRPELRLTEGAKRALMNANAQNGSLPQGTPESVTVELRKAGYIASSSMTGRGRDARRRLLGDLMDWL